MPLIISNKDKYKKLLEVSDPKKVLENAKKYFNDPNIELYISNSKLNKYMIYDDNMKKINFGSIKYQDYTYTNDPIKRERYLKRSANIHGSWRDNKYSRNNLSRFLLWNANE